MIDPDGFILTWNKGAQNIKGYREEEIIGKHISIFYTPGEISQKEPQENLKEALASGSFEKEGWRVRKNGSVFWANIVFTPLYDEAGMLLGFAKVTRDMTGQKMISDQKEQHKIELERRVKENTETIIKNEMRYRALIESNYSGVTLLDKSFKAIYRSRPAERINGWLDAERGQQTMADLVHPDDLPAVQNLFLDVLNQPGVPVQATYRVKHQKGYYIWLESINTNMLADKAIEAIVCNFRDVTEKKNADDEIKNKTEQIANILESITDGFMALDSNLCFTYVNNQFGGMTGFSPEAIIGKYIWDVFPAASAAARNGFDLALRERRNVTFEDYYQPLDFWAEDRLYPSAGGLSVFVRDITERKKAEQLLRSKNEQIENILERITDGFVALDNNLRYTYVNKRIGEMAGISPADMIGKYIWDVFPEAVGTAAQKVFDLAIQEQRYVSFEENYAPLDIWVEEHLYPSEGGLSVFARDISARKKAEREILLLNESLERKVEDRTKQLEAANKELEAFSYSVSHDLRTPLRAVGGFAMMLKDGFETMQTADRNRIVNTIVNNATLMGQLIDDLLDFSRLGRKELKLNKVNIQSMVKGCISELTYDNPKTYEFKIEELPDCEGDTSMIKQVWMNLLGNAIKYSSKIDKPVIEVGAKIDGNVVTYFVRDNGVGFDMQYAGKLFGVFQRLHRKDEFEGTGVGLALVKRVIDRHGGKLSVKATPGKGAIFYFSLPVKQAN